MDWLRLRLVTSQGPGLVCYRSSSHFVAELAWERCVVICSPCINARIAQRVAASLPRIGSCSERTENWLSATEQTATGAAANDAPSRATARPH